MDQAVLFNVVFGHGQRVGGDIDGVHFRFRESVGAGNSDAAAAGAHIENVLRLMVNQAFKVIVDQLTNRRVRYQHAFIDVKLVAAEPGFVGQISNRNALVYTTDHALNDTMFFAGGQARGAHVFRNIQRQVKRRQHQLNGLVSRVIGTVTVPDIGGAKAANRPAQHVLYGMQLVLLLHRQIFYPLFPPGHARIIFGG